MINLELSILRLSGLILSFICFVFIFFKLRKPGNHPKNILALNIFTVTLLIVSLFPSVVNLPADLFNLVKYPNGRLITLLIISTLLIWPLFLIERSKSITWATKVENIVRTVALQNYFVQKYSNLIDKEIIILIPAMNEGENISYVLQKISSEIVGKKTGVLVIDDGSTDDTKIKAEKYGAEVISHSVNLGGGAALKTGYEIAKQLNIKYIVTLDGDGQHDPQDIEKLVSSLINNKADLVIGSRKLGSSDNYSFTRSTGLSIFNFLIQVLIGIKITDCASGYRAFSTNLLYQIRLNQRQYHTAEMIIEATKQKLKIVEEPIHISKRLSGTSKKGKNLTYAFSFLSAVIKTWLRS